MTNLQPPSQSARHQSGWVPLALGFRPFFLLGALAAVLLMSTWVMVWRGALGAPVHYDPIAWHAHEMLFGYAVAVISGFLLTAVRNWTGVPTWTGPSLGLLVALWLLGRVLPWLPDLPRALPAVVDVAFLPLLTLSLVRPLWSGQNKVNRIFLVLLSAMALTNLLSHLQLSGDVTALGDARHIMLELILLLIVIVAGRVLPFFARNVIPGFEPVTRRWVETGTVLSLLSVIVLQALVPSAGGWLGVLWALFGAIQCVRLYGWFDVRVLRIPVLWVLYAGFAWLTLGALLNSAAAFGVFPASSALHALTAGAVGVFTLGMMARVTRGHTGRAIDVSRMMTAGFVVLNLGVFVRVFGPVVWAAGYPRWIDLSAALWMLAFGVFIARYSMMLMRARVDGKPG